MAGTDAGARAAAGVDDDDDDVDKDQEADAEEGVSRLTRREGGGARRQRLHHGIGGRTGVRPAARPCGRRSIAGVCCCCRSGVIWFVGALSMMVLLFLVYSLVH